MVAETRSERSGYDLRDQAVNFKEKSRHGEHIEERLCSTHLSLQIEMPGHYFMLVRKVLHRASTNIHVAAL